MLIGLGASGNVSPDDGKAIMARIDSYLNDQLLPQMRKEHQATSIQTEIISVYPGLDHRPQSTALKLLQTLIAQQEVQLVPFGTACALFSAGRIRKRRLRSGQHCPGSQTG